MVSNICATCSFTEGWIFIGRYFSDIIFSLCKYNTILMNLKWVSKNWDKFIFSQKKMNVLLIFISIEISLKVGIASKDLIIQICNQENNHIKWLKRIDQPNQVDNSSVFISFVLVSCFENTVLNDSVVVKAKHVLRLNLFLKF
jgi:hypothetical protein